MELKQVGRFIKEQTKETYREFALVKIILNFALAIIIVLVGGITSYLYIPGNIHIFGIILSVIIGGFFVWNGLKWAFPRYMVVDYALNKRK